MFLYKEISALQKHLSPKDSKSPQTGFIPTMGSLHAGHLALIRACKEQGNRAVCSIFINPTQFNRQDDFDKYPREIEKDIELLYAAGCDVLFHPLPSMMYPDGYAIQHYDYGNITNSLEGFHRPGHFDGVITVVKKLLDIVQPDHIYIGQKDFQQCAVIHHLIQVNGFSTIPHVIPTMREESGLAMSSRNARLSALERKEAVILYDTLEWINGQPVGKSVQALKDEAVGKISRLLKTEYLEIVNYETLDPVAEMKRGEKYVALVAAWCGNVRLIDNMILDGDGLETI